jgi:hypothetical protein
MIAPHEQPGQGRRQRHEDEVEAEAEAESRITGRRPKRSDRVPCIGALKNCIAAQNANANAP